MIERWPFTGRAGELARVESVHAAGRGVLVIGPEGVGKTAFVRALSHRIEAGGGAVVSIVGRAAADAMPMESFGPVLDAMAGSPVGFGARLRSALGAEAGQRVTVVVDDVNRLDTASAAALLQLASAGDVSVVATAREAPGVPEPIVRLWQDGLCEWLELQPLGRTEIAELLEAALDGQVDAVSAQRLAELAAGNGLLLRELVGAALEQGRLIRRNDVWRLLGDPPLGGGARQLVAERIEALPVHLRPPVDAIAAGEPLPLAAALEVAGEGHLEDLEQRHIVEVLDTLDGPTVRLAHPLYGEVIRADLPRLRLRRLRLNLARSLELSADPAPHDLVRAAVWRLEAGDDRDHERFVAAARAAQAFSLEIAERLARRAFEVSGSIAAAVLLAEILVHDHKSAAADELLAALPPDSLGPADREAVVYCTAMGQGLLGGDPGKGASMIEDVVAGVPDASPRLGALHSLLVAMDGRSQDAIDIAAPLLDDESIDPVSRTFAGLAVTGALYGLGRYRASVAVGERMMPVSIRALEAVPFGPSALGLSMSSALAECGELDRSEALGAAMVDGAGADLSNWARPRSDYCLGRAALVRGRVRTAMRLFRSTLSGLNAFDATFTLHNRSMLARAAAAAGQLDDAAAALDAPADAVRLRVYETEWELAEAALLAAQGRLAEAVDRAGWVAELAASRGQWMVALLGGHDAARYGGSHIALAGIREAATHTEGPLAWCYLDHATALASRDAGALDEVSRRFQSCGAILYAADSAAEAAEAHSAAGQPRAARASAGRARLLRASCEGAVSPWLVGAAGGVTLTGREREVAALAAGGRTDAEIAGALHISIRTVQTHLARVYDKLGIHGRHELGDSAL